MMPLQIASENVSNASSSLAGSFGDTGALLGLVAVTFLVIAILLVSTKAYLWAYRAAGAFARSVEYAIKGTVTAAVITVFAAPFYLVSQADAGTRVLIAKSIAAIVIVYAVLVVLGIAGEFVWGLIKRRHVEATGHEPFENTEEEA